MMALYDLAIVGGGIVGMATAMEAVTRYPGMRLLLLEKESQLAAHQTGHNSGVIHSGVYYKPGSLKANLCVKGASAMLTFCRERGIPVSVCGKVIVATRKDELPWLEELLSRATANGVPKVRKIGPVELKEIEPHSTGLGALHVPGTGITDYAAVTRGMAQVAEQKGAELQTGCEVRRIVDREGAAVIETTAGEFAAKHVVNCAGLHSDHIARCSGARLDMRIVPFRGEYYELLPERHGLVKGLIYPVPDLKFPFLGVHFTRRVGGGVEAGPNAVLALKREGYRKTAFKLADVADMAKFPGFWRMSARYWKTGAAEYYRSLNKQSFTRALQKLVPGVQEADLGSASAGVRAQAVDSSGNLLDDFCFVSQQRMIHVCNVPSPAATASIMIGRAIIDMADREWGVFPQARSALPVS